MQESSFDDILEYSNAYGSAAVRHAGVTIHKLMNKLMNLLKLMVFADADQPTELPHHECHFG